MVNLKLCVDNCHEYKRIAKNIPQFILFHSSDHYRALDEYVYKWFYIIFFPQSLPQLFHPNSIFWADFPYDVVDRIVGLSGNEMKTVSEFQFWPCEWSLFVFI